MKIQSNVLKIVWAGLFIFSWANLSDAATYYVRPDGGTSVQCNGLADAAYPGSGTGKACAFKHPFWAIAPIGNNPTKMVGGDTLIIDGTGGTQYMIGYGAPNTSDTAKCHSSWPWDCQMRTIPSGPDATHPTRILGKGWNTGCAQPPHLYGRERLRQVLNLTGSSNVELQCLEITDHSDCQDPGPKACNRSSFPYGDWTIWGIIASDSSNVLLKNVNIHGMAHGGINAGRLKDWTLDGVSIVGNAFVGWDGDIGADISSNSGTLSFNKVTIAYNGCGETYPGKTPFNCFSQSQSGYGDGIGTAKTGGNWIFTNSNISHNTSDGIDLLYHNGNGTVTINRTKAEGNAGNQVKSSADTTITNSVLISNCAYFKNNPLTWNSTTFDHCRAFGSTLSFNLRAGSKISVMNSTVISNGDTLILAGGTSCNGTESIYSRNNIFLGRPDYNGGDISSLYYASGAAGNGDGPCGTVKLNDDYSIIYGTKYNSTDCSNRPHSKCIDPKMAEPLVSYYTGNAYNVALQSSSPAVGTGIVLTGVSNLDFNGFTRGTTWDIGALEYGSKAGTTTTSSSSTSTCGNGVVDSGEQCDGTKLNSQTCVTKGYTGGTLSCSSSCTFVTSACTSSVPKSPTPSTSGTAVCGNGIVESGEWCDGNNLNGQTCSSRGFSGGSLKCYNCSFNTFFCYQCGNAILDPGEECDGGSFGNQTCESEGFAGGTLSCSSTCRVETSDCDKCGNGVIDSGEWCDGNNLNGQTCVSRGFTGGYLKCYRCTYNTFYCTK